MSAARRKKSAKRAKSAKPVERVAEELDAKSAPDEQEEDDVIDVTAEPADDEDEDDTAVVEVVGSDDDGSEDDSEESLLPVPAPSSSGVARSGGASADALSWYLHQVRSYPEIDPEEQRELARRYRDTGDPEAARLLITANLRLVVKLSLMYRRALRNVMDLIQEGTVGLIEALKRYDPEQGVRFSTYAAWWIKAYILKFLLDNARLVRVGTTNARRKLLYNLRKEQQKLQQQGIEPTPKLLADRFNVSEQDVVDIDQALSSRDVSVDAPLSDESQTTFADTIESEAPSVDETVATSQMRERVDDAVNEFRRDLNERERAILDLRLVSESPETLQQLGDRFGVTREAMRQAEVKLKARLAEYLREHLGSEIILKFTQ